MLLIPAIDLKEGKCVRLKQGRMSDATVFSDDPVAMARHWAAQGCRRLHLVDLDGAFAGEPRNRELIARMTEAVPGVPVQVGGGVRSEAIIEGYLEAGIAQVIVGTRAIEEPAFLARICEQFPGRIILGLDARVGQLATAGWDATSDRSAVEFARWAGGLGVFAIVYTDIDRDGMLTGVNVPATLALAEAAQVPVIASGGVATLDDVRALKAAFAPHRPLLMGAITGRAIYAGTLNLREGQALFDQPAEGGC
jgi:phosphoribosylformimino-5-aminoimidazole carboxamide ribotide isomerase